MIGRLLGWWQMLHASMDERIGAHGNRGDIRLPISACHHWEVNPSSGNKTFITPCQAQLLEAQFDYKSSCAIYPQMTLHREAYPDDNPQPKSHDIGKVGQRAGAANYSCQWTTLRAPRADGLLGKFPRAAELVAPFGVRAAAKCNKTGRQFILSGSN